MTEGPRGIVRAARDEWAESVSADLEELSRRPSQHSAAYVRDTAESARALLHILLTDLRGWEETR